MGLLSSQPVPSRDITVTFAGDSQAERVRVSEEGLWFGCRTLCPPVSWEHGPGASHGQGTSPAEEARDLPGQQRSCAGPTLAVPEDPSERQGREQRWCRGEVWDPSCGALTRQARSSRHLGSLLNTG